MLERRMHNSVTVSPLSIKTVGLKKQLRGPVHHPLQLSGKQFKTNLDQRKKEKTKAQTIN